MLVALASAAWCQTGYWRDNKTLWKHAVDTIPNNDFAHKLVGQCPGRRRKYPRRD